MMYTLVIWTVVGYAGTQMTTWREYDWRPITDVASLDHCKKAAADLGIVDEKKFRCLKKQGSL